MIIDIHPLRPCEHERAYILVHLMKPEVDLARWRAYLASIDRYGRGRGTTVASLGKDCLVALYTWATQPSLDHENVFSVDNFIAAGALDPEPLFEKMIEEMDRQAQRLGCGAMQVSLPSVFTGKKQQRLLVDCFLAQGYAVADQKLRRVRAQVGPLIAARESAPGNKVPGALR